MAFFDWNHDGKKNYVDTAIEMMIIDDIEGEGQKANAGSSNTAYRKKYHKSSASPEEVDKVFEAMKPAGYLWAILLSVAVLGMNLIGLISGYVSVPGIIVSIVVLILIFRKIKKDKKS